MSFFSSGRLDERRIGKQKIEDLKKKRTRTLAIHYSCESFFNTHGRTPRITSIAVKNRDNGTAIIFSIHLTAQIKKKALEDLSDLDFDLLERETLKEFYEFVNRHKTYNWTHWNMRNASFGFEAIANRYRILGGNPKIIEDQFKFDLPEILGQIYTHSFEDHKTPAKGQLLNISIRNNITIRDALNGAQEAEAFDRRNFLELHMSTMRKVEMIDRILNLEERKELKVAVSLKEQFGLTFGGIIEIVQNNRLLITIWSILMAILGMVLEPIAQKIFGTAS